MSEQQKRPTVLIILDGFGEAPPSDTNAITVADPRFLQDLRQMWPHTSLDASGEDSIMILDYKTGSRKKFLERASLATTSS